MKNGSDFINKVAVVRCDSYNKQELIQKIESCVSLIGGFKKYIRPGQRILLKPNLLSASRPELAVTTHPVFIESIIDIIKKNVFSDVEIIIADSPGAATPHTIDNLRKVYKECGIEYISKIKGVKLSMESEFSLISFKEGKVLKHLEIIKPAVDADVIINLPKFKTHSLTRITGAVKNMYGTVHGRTKTLLHTKFIEIDKFCDMLLDIYLYRPPELNIMDGIIGLEGEGPGASGKPRSIGMIFAGTNGIAVDCLISEIMGFKSEDVPIIKCAGSRGLEGSDIGKIEIIGAGIKDLLIKNFKLPKNTPVDRITKNRFVKAYMLPFIRNHLYASPYKNNEKCTLCEICVNTCPEKAVILKNQDLIFDYKKCIRCYCCSEMCPCGAVDLKYSFLGNLIFGKGTVK
ncbi:MAG: DUF362 domain-containing protein [Actinobacteria bacterium]|nr:DUF362 domain-containing protein [Actinomycetota bacterium]